MLQVMLCAICMMSAALFYYDFVIIPRQNRELVEDLKSHFPEEFPPGGGSPTQKEEQAGRELEVPAVDFRSLQSQYPDVRGWLTIQESGIDYPVLQSSPEEPEYYLPRDYRGNYDINGSLFLQADCVHGYCVVERYPYCTLLRQNIREFPVLLQYNRPYCAGQNRPA